VPVRWRFLRQTWQVLGLSPEVAPPHLHALMFLVTQNQAGILENNDGQNAAAPGTEWRLATACTAQDGILATAVP